MLGRALRLERSVAGDGVGDISCVQPLGSGLVYTVGVPWLLGPG